MKLHDGTVFLHNDTLDALGMGVLSTDLQGRVLIASGHARE